MIHKAAPLGGTLEWTSGFLDERLVEPVSPLGWSVLRPGLEEIAFREPLRMLGVDPATLEPITRLWNGHPYANVAVFEALYKLFPDWLLPEDARRYFPNGDTSRRQRAPRPRSLLAPEVASALLRSVLADPVATLPFSNVGAWVRFEGRYERACVELGRAVDALEREPSPNLATVIALIDRVEAENRELLRIHRWSLTHAEVCYSLLRRLARALAGPERAQRYCAEVVGSLGDKTVRLNRALDELRGLARANRPDQLEAGIAQFLAEFGHRSYSLDLLQPGFAADPSQLLALIDPDGPPLTAPGSPRAGEKTSSPSGPAVTAFALEPLAAVTRRYLRLREDQRFAWQRGLALLRRLYLLAGQVMAEAGHLGTCDDVFYLTAEEVRRAALETGSDLRETVAARRREFADACASFARDASASYPPFLRGAEPEAPVGDVALEGMPVSPGIGRGRARVVVRPDELASVQPGEVLVTRGADPGWTVVFERLAALVTESGGQLSHAAVVAREYRLPAVLGVSGATTRIRTGDLVAVDGDAGVVRVDGEGLA
jgi:pyruvate,water dikinase